MKNKYCYPNNLSTKEWTAKSVSMQNSKQCPFCGHSEIDVYSGVLSVWKCLSCGLLFRDISKTGIDHAKLYKNAWLDCFNHKDETGGTDPELARLYLQKLLSFLGIKNLAGLKILDFGAGRGDMLAALSQLGADAYGVESFGYTYLNNKGRRVFRCIEEIPKDFLFDGIIAIDVIEHLFYPWGTINQLYGILGAQGWFYITTPNLGSLNSRFFMSHWRELQNPSHIYFFNPVCFETILTKLSIAKYKRLNWFIKYSDNPLRRVVHFILQFLKLDGELRYILRKV